MIRRLGDALLLLLAVVYGHHLGVLAIRAVMSKRGLGSSEGCAEALTVLLPPRRPDCLT